MGGTRPLRNEGNGPQEPEPGAELDVLVALVLEKKLLRQALDGRGERGVRAR